MGKLRIVAFIGQDLSAAAILTLSVREIYAKPSATIGAATSYVPGHMDLPAKIEEKMQSAWRAEARRSAEEGRHEPLLSEAMIDNDLELHVETIDGKPAMVEGPGRLLLCRKGKILTMTGRDALQCGLCAGEADDLAELGEVLHFGKWAAMEGLGTLLAAAVPERGRAYKMETEKISARLKRDFAAARASDPSRTLTLLTQSQTDRAAHAKGSSTTGFFVRTVPPTQWKPLSLATVIALQQCETDLDDGMSLAQAYGHISEAALIDGTKSTFTAIRATIFDNRDKFGSAVTAAPAANPFFTRGRRQPEHGCTR